MKFIFRTVPSWGPTILRIALGVCMLMHGVGKLVDPATLPAPLNALPGGGFAATHAFMQSKAPEPFALAGTLAEAVGGLLVVLGLATRLGAALIAAQMGVAAYLGGHLANGYFGAKGGGPGYELHMLLIAMALALVLLGGGKASVDCAIGGCGEKT